MDEKIIKNADIDGETKIELKGVKYIHINNVLFEADYIDCVVYRKGFGSNAISVLLKKQNMNIAFASTDELKFKYDADKLHIHAE
jgi:hypothetical protein